MVNLTMCLRKKNKKNNLTVPLRMPEFTSGRNMPGTVENNNTINILIDDRVRPVFFLTFWSLSEYYSTVHLVFSLFNF